MAIRMMLLILGAFHFVNGLWMLASPDAWYAAVPGVRDTGPLNHHFIADIGLAFLASGAGLALGALRRSWAAAAAVAGATWPLLHAGLHVSGWLIHGFPSAGPVIVSELVGVVTIGLLGAGLAWARVKHVEGGV
jgi:hypothetical protein